MCNTVMQTLAAEVSLKARGILTSADNNSTNDEPINPQNTGHNDWDNIPHDAVCVNYSHACQANTTFGSAVC